MAMTINQTRWLHMCFLSRPLSSRVCFGGSIGFDVTATASAFAPSHSGPDTRFLDSAMSSKEDLNQKFGIDKTMMPEHETDPKATTGPGHVHLSESQIQGLEKPKSKEELRSAAASMNT